MPDVPNDREGSLGRTGSFPGKGTGISPDSPREAAGAEGRSARPGSPGSSPSFWKGPRPLRPAMPDVPDQAHSDLTGRAPRRARLSCPASHTGRTPRPLHNLAAAAAARQTYHIERLGWRPRVTLRRGRARTGPTRPGAPVGGSRCCGSRVTGRLYQTTR